MPDMHPPKLENETTVNRYLKIEIMFGVKTKN